MSNVSYNVQLTVKPGMRDKAKETFGEMQDQWQSMSGDFDLDEMILAYDDTSGVFSFDTKGIIGISPALMDDTNLFVRELGSYSEEGAVVQHMYNGEKSDFAVGPNTQAKKAAIEDDQIIQAIGHLEQAKGFCPPGAGLRREINKIIETLQKLA